MHWCKYFEHNFHSTIQSSIYDGLNEKEVSKIVLPHGTYENLRVSLRLHSNFGKFNNTRILIFKKKYMPTVLTDIRTFKQGKFNCLSYYNGKTIKKPALTSIQCLENDTRE